MPYSCRTTKIKTPKIHLQRLQNFRDNNPNYFKAYYQLKKKKMREQMAKWQEEHHSCYRKQQNTYHHEHLKQYTAYQKEYHHWYNRKNRERINLRSKIYRLRVKLKQLKSK